MGLSFLINDRSFLLLHFICQLCTKYLMLILRLERWFREICLSYIFLMNFPSKKICCFTFSLNNKFVLVEDERVGKTLNMYFDFFHMLGTICDIFWYRISIFMHTEVAVLFVCLTGVQLYTDTVVQR